MRQSRILDETGRRIFLRPRCTSGPDSSRLFGEKVATGTEIVQARYDAAVTTDENRRHWANADALSANAAASAAVRAKLRNRSRYEVANNSYALGILLTLVNDVIGAGPRLQMLGDNAKANAAIESAFAAWAAAVRLPEKLRTMRMARARDGEAFAVMTQNPNLPSPVMLDLQLIEADQVATPIMVAAGANEIDGIIFDEYGNPVEYHVLGEHPGGTRINLPLNYTSVKAEHMIHTFRADRPGQSRGVPEITPALPLFAQLRRYTQAVLDAAESAADFAGVLYTDQPAGEGGYDATPGDQFELQKRMLTVMPDGWRMGQIEAQQPSSTYRDFKRELLNEIARCLNMPFNIAAGNSSDYNYASGRLDHQTYFKSIRVDHQYVAWAVLDRILAAWLREAELLTEFSFLRRLDHFSQKGQKRHQWFWPGTEHVDPLKEANAQAKRLETAATTLAIEYAKQGLDWQEQLRQRGKEVALMRELDLPVPQPKQKGA